LKELKALFFIYKPQGVSKALWTILRILILPYEKIDELVPPIGTIVDIGCGNGALTHYLLLKSPKRVMKGIDLSKNRISIALNSVKNKKNIQFMYGDATTSKLPRVDCYLMVDVLHHIPFQGQEKLLKFLAKSLGDNSILIIKEVDKSNHISYLFSHFIEKLLYPKEHIYARGKQEWIKLFKSLGLSSILKSGASYFPDSTKIFILSKKQTRNKDPLAKQKGN
jgi:SAM-dependent methyltransferase